MLDQTNNPSSNLQQPRNDLQPNSPSLQQGDVSDGGMANPVDILNQPAPGSQIEVITSAESNSSVKPVTMTEPSVDFALLLPAVLVIVIAVSVIWLLKRPRAEPLVVPQPEPASPIPIVSSKRPKSKKTSKRKRGTKR